MGLLAGIASRPTFASRRSDEQEGIDPLKALAKQMIQQLEKRPGLTASSCPTAPSESARLDSAKIAEPGDIRARWISNFDEIEQHRSAWQALAKQAIHRNFSFDPDFLIPALQHLNHVDAKLLVVERVDGESVQWLALAPLHFKTVYRLPLKTMEIWKDEQCFDSTPLLDRSHARIALTTMFQFLKQEGVSWLSADTIFAGDEFAEVWQDVVQQTCGSTFQRSLFERAAMIPAESYEEYEKAFVSKSIRKNAKRQFRKLSELGDLQFHESNAESDFKLLTDQFLKLEASGWKGENGTAMACSEDTRQFFESIIQRTSQSGKVKFFWLQLDDQPIGMLCDFYQEGIGFAYKTCFDDAYAKFSPGVITEFLNVEQMHRNRVQYVDSCTEPDNATINRLWGQRLPFQKTIVSLRSGFSSWLLRCLPSIQTLARRFKKRTDG